MDSLEQAIREDIICLGGEQGVTLEQLWELIGAVLRRTLGIETLNDSSKEFLWQQLIAAGEYYLTFADTRARPDPSRSVTSLPSDVRVVIPREERLLFYTAGKPVRLTDAQVKALEIIARSQRRGVTQAEAAKQLSLDARSFFHQLKALLEYRLISKIPVSQQRTFTYLLHLTRYAEFEDEMVTTMHATEASSKPLFVPSASSIRGRIMELLQSAPQRTLSAGEIYRLVQADAKAIKIYRKHIAWLVTHGHVECFVAEELGGVMGKILRWKRPLNEMATAGAPKKGVGRSEGSNPPGEATSPAYGHHSSGPPPICPVLTKAVALERQVHDYINASGSDGVTLAQIMVDFGLNRKLGYRIGDRLTSEKVWSDSDVIKVAEFYGKERRHRYYTRQGQGQRPRSPTRTIADIEAEEGHGPLGERTEDALIVTPASGTGAARDSINRTRRLQILRELLDELRMIEAGKQLAVELQRRLGEHEFIMDTKTLKRLIALLEQAGDCHTVVVALPTGGSRTILLHRTLSLSDPSVQGYIESVKRSKVELSSGQRPDIVKGGEDSTLIGPLRDDSQAGPLPPAGSTGKNHKYQMQKHGFIHGIMARCRLLHRYLLRGAFLTSGEEWQACETLPWLFRHLPFDLFLRLVGLAEMSPQLTYFMASVRPEELTMDSLPKTIRQEIHRRRVDAHKRTMKRLMECLCQLGLATVDNRYPSVAFRLPYQYRLARHASIIDVGTGQLRESLDLIQENNFDRYWDWLESLSKADRTVDTDDLSGAHVGAKVIQSGQSKEAASSSSKADHPIMAPSLPSIYQNIIMVRESWQVASSNRRLLRKALRELIRRQDELGTDQEQILRLGRPNMEIARELAELQSDYEIGSLEGVQAEYVALLAERTEQRVRRQRTRQQRQRVRRQLRPRSEEIPGSRLEERDEEEGGLVREPENDDAPLSEARRSTKALLSEAEMQMLRLATALLHRPSLRSGPGNLQWSLVEALSRPRIHLLPTALGDEVRALVTRLALSYDQQAKPMMELERELAFLEAAIKAGVLDPEPAMTPSTNQEEYFVALVQFYADLLRQLPSIKERIRILGSGRLLTQDMIPVRFNLSQAMQAIPWQRMSRLQQQHYFADLPPYQVRGDEQRHQHQYQQPMLLTPSRPQQGTKEEYLDNQSSFMTPMLASTESPPLSWSPFETEVAILKRTLMVPVPGEYQVEVAHAQLKTADPIRLETALNLLLGSRLMARGTLANYVQRPLGGEYSVHARFLEIIDGIERWDPFNGPTRQQAEGRGEEQEQEQERLIDLAPSSQATEEKSKSPPVPSLVQTLRTISRGLAQVDLTSMDGLRTIKTDGPRQIRNRLEETILHFSSTSNPNFNPRSVATSSDSSSSLGGQQPGIMVWDLGPRRSSILRASCKFVYEVIEAIPTGGTSLQQLSAACWPFLTTAEVETVLSILQEAGLLERETGTPFVFLK